MHQKAISLKIITFVAIIFFALLSYWNSFQGPFVFDDIGYIKSNIKIRDLSRVGDIWRSLPNPSRFIGMMTFALNYHVHQYEVFGYHLVNFLIHLTNTVLVWWLIQNLGKTPYLKRKYEPQAVDQISCIAALIFLTHPIQTQAVTYIAQRFASLATIFYLLSCSLYIKGRLSQKHAPWYLGASACVALVGMATKQIVMTLPLMLLWIEFLFIYSFKKEGSLYKRIPWKIVGLVSLFLLIVPAFYSFDIMSRFYEEGVVHNGSHRGDPLSTRIYLLTQFCVVATYLKLLFFPIGQNLLYDFRSSLSLWEWKTFSCFLLLAAIFVIGIWLIRRKRLMAFGIFWFFTALLVESSIIMIKHVIFEHRCYLPSVGFALFVAVGVYHLFKSPRKLVVALCILVGTLSYLTHKRNYVWQSDVRLWEDGIKKSPDKSRPYMNLGIAYMERGKHKEAIGQFTQSVKNNARNYGAFSNRGTSYFAVGEYDKALEDFNKSLEIHPKYAEAYINRGNYYGSIKEYEKSIADYNKALELQPESSEALLNRGNKYARMGKYKKALEDYNQSLVYSPKFAQAYRNRANVYERMRKYDLALKDYNRAIELDGSKSDYYLHRGNVYLKKELWQLALADYNKTLELNPGNVSGYAKRVKIHMYYKQYDKAASDLMALKRAGVQVDEGYLARIQKLALEN